jgi:hypothetical protein
VTLVEREDVGRSVPLGKDDDRRVGQPEPEVGIPIQDLSGASDVDRPEELERKRAIGDLGSSSLAQ